MDKLLIIIGCAKSGTSSVAAWLDTRSDMVLGRRKEPSFFTDFSDKNWNGPGSILPTKTFDEYVRNFPNLSNDQWAIDATTDYIWCPVSAELIHDFSRNRDVRIICITRDPISRAVSEYNHTLRLEWETLSFSDSLEAEELRTAENWHPLFYHQRRSTFSEDLKRYSSLFGSKMLVLDFSELRDPQKFIYKVTKFLNIPHVPISNPNIENQSYLPRNLLVAKILKNKSIRSLGRNFIPAAFQANLLKILYVNSRIKNTVLPYEKEKLRTILKDEIRRCVESPIVPTEGWSKETLSCVLKS